MTQSNPHRNLESYQDAYVLRRIQGLGLLWNKSGDGWLGISGLKSAERTLSIERLILAGKLLEVQVEGLKELLYMSSTFSSLLTEALQQDKASGKAYILAPLDNLLWERRLLKELFSFDYRWEVYKPESDREYGYYVLPVLYGDKFVARFEPRRDKSQDSLIIMNWWWEPNVRKTKALKVALHLCFEQFKQFVGASTVIFPDDSFFSE